MNAYRKPIENLEDRRMFTAINGNDTITITQSDNTKENANTVVISFNGTVKKTVDISKIRMFGYANNTIIGGQVKVTIPIVSASIDSTNKKLFIRTGAQVRKGTQVTLNTGAVDDTAGDDVLGTVKLKKGLNRNRFTLALRAFQVTGKQYFSNEVISGGAATTTANVAESESVVRAQLDAFLGKKVTAGSITSTQRSAALTRYDSSAAKGVIPAHNLRAAVLSLVGTAGAPAIETWLGTNNTSKKTPVFVGYGATDSSRYVELTYNSSGRLRLTWSTNYQGENFAVLSGRMAHEAMHDGGSGAANIDSQDEEVVANFVESAVYAQQLHTDYRIGLGRDSSTPVSNYAAYQNYHLYTLLNSGDRQFPRVGVKAAPLVNGTTNATPGFIASKPSFDQLIRDELAGRISNKPPTPITTVAASLLNNVAGGNYTATTTTYGKTLIDSIDQTQGVMSDAFVMLSARDLQTKIFA